MNRSEAAVLLTKAQVIDNRNFDAATASMWAELLHDIEIDDALRALSKHFGYSTAYLTPAHIRELVSEDRGRRRELIHAAGAVDFPPNLTLGQEKEYRKRYNRLIGDGLSREDAHAGADEDFRVVREVGSVPMPADVRRALGVIAQGFEVA